MTLGKELSPQRHRDTEKKTKKMDGINFRKLFTHVVLLLLFSVPLCLCGEFYAQSKRTPRRNQPAKNYSAFSHRSVKHKSLACDACHKAPTENWVRASGIPDVADYPTHESCTSCHRAEFFRGARPVICSICHTKVAPRAKERFVFSKPGQPSQFSTIFPHDKHQDVIAAVAADSSTSEWVSAHSSIRRSSKQEKPAQVYNNCAICHVAPTELPKTGAPFPDNFQPPNGTFKNSPIGHASCFNCHWKAQQPASNQCAGCHLLSGVDVATLFVPQRKSLKFTHTREQHIAECTTCHVNITRASSLRGLQPDVPISACSSCHKTSTDASIATIETEYEQRNRTPSFVCAKCHVSDVGRLALPSSHRAIFAE